MQEIGEIKQICRYPVKSMAGEMLPSIYVHETGLNGDRIFALYDCQSKRNALPYLTAREKNKLLLIKPKILNEPNRLEKYPSDYRPKVLINIDDAVLDIEDTKFISQIKSKLGISSDLMLDYRLSGIQDSKPVSIMGLQTIQGISQEAEIQNLDVLRFRENFYVDWLDKKPFYEDLLVGKSIKIGGVILHFVKRNERCPIICINPESARYNKQVLNAVAKNHEKNAGILAVVRTPGVVFIGDKIYL